MHVCLVHGNFGGHIIFFLQIFAPSSQTCTCTTYCTQPIYGEPCACYVQYIRVHINYDIIMVCVPHQCITFCVCGAILGIACCYSWNDSMTWLVDPQCEKVQSCVNSNIPPVDKHAYPT